MRPVRSSSEAATLVLSMGALNEIETGVVEPGAGGDRGGKGGIRQRHDCRQQAASPRCSWAVTSPKAPIAIRLPTPSATAIRAAIGASEEDRNIDQGEDGHGQQRGGELSQ